MRIAPYWSRARLDEAGRASPDGPMVAFGWSFESQTAADAHAHERAVRLGRLFAEDRAPEHDAYYDGDRPVREPILASYGGEAPWAVITRNRYGARVLNAAEALFVDLDLPGPPPDPRTWWQRLMGAPRPEASDPSVIVDRARAVVAAHPGMGLRLYRTAHGFRGLVTDAPWTPAAAEPVLEAFGSDPLYRRLCRVQQCFRARLEPKPWRMGMAAPPGNWFPEQEDAALRAVFLDWLARYDAARQDWSVCQVVDHLGASDVHPEVAPVLDLHDREVLGDRRLA